jgi:glycosyltransferase involved in cell wall biosynthesis
VGIAGLADLLGGGVIVEDDPDRMAEAVAGLLADDAHAARIGGAGSAAVRARYTWDDTLSAMVERVRR